MPVPKSITKIAIDYGYCRIGVGSTATATFPGTCINYRGNRFYASSSRGSKAISSVGISSFEVFQTSSRSISSYEMFGSSIHNS